MADTLNQAQIAKYAARLQGQRLLPVLQEWQIKRAICRLAADGSTHALDAIKRGVEKGVLSKPPYSALLEFVLVRSVSPANTQRVRAHLRPPELIKQPETPPRPQRDWSSGVGMATPAQPPVKAEPESFSTTNNPIQLLREQLKTSAPLESYRIELRERVRQDSSRRLLQEICELWDRSVGSQKEGLRELIAFIELVPERPLWLRRNVALDCGMPWQLADDSPAIAQHLVDTIQLRTRKLAIISACRKLRREDTKTEICELWFKQYKQGVHDNDFDDVLLKLGFLPKEPLEQRVAIALTCGWAERLAYDDTEVLVFLLPLLDHPRLRAEAQRALKNIKNPLTLKAFEEQLKAETQEEDNREPSQQNEDHNKAVINQGLETAVETEEKDEDRIPAIESDLTDAGEDEPAGPEHIVTSLSEKILAVDLNTADPVTSDSDNSLKDSPSPLDTPVDEGEDHLDTSPQGKESNTSDSDSPPQTESPKRPVAKPYLDFKRDAQLEDDWEEISLAAAEWDDEESLDSDWISRLDRIAGLSPEERNKIILQIADSRSGDDDWIFDLLSAGSISEFDSQYNQLNSRQQGQGSNPVMASEPQIHRDQSESAQSNSKELSNNNNLARLKQLLSAKGLRTEDDGQFLRVSMIIGDYTREIDTIEINILNKLKHSDALEYAEACMSMAIDIGLKPHEAENRSINDIQETTHRHASEEASLSTLFLDDLASNALDSASVFLIACASELLSSQTEKQHSLSPFHKLIAGLLTFHTRERSAEIKAYEEAMESNQEALLNNSDCIAGAFLEEVTPYKDDVYAARYRFDPQQSFRHSTQKGKSKPKVISQQSHALLEIDSIDNTTGIATLLVKAVSKDCLDHEANFIYIPPNFS